MAETTRTHSQLYTRGPNRIPIEVSEHSGGGERLALIEKYLIEQGFDPNGLKRLGDLLVLDAQDLLDMVMTDGSPNADMFRETMKRFLDQLCRGRDGCSMRAFADVIDLLWRGEISATAAIRLETLWNELAAARGESFMSSYALGHF